MHRDKLFIWLAAASGYTGLGMALGWLMSDQVDMTPLLIGVVLILLGATLVGMYISSHKQSSVKAEEARLKTSETIDRTLD